MKAISAFIILTILVSFLIACKSSKAITQNEQIDIIEINDYFSDTNEENILIDYFEEQALFDGKPADKAFPDYVYKNLIWTELMDGMSGRVIVEFVIETDGLVSNVKIIRGVDPVLDAEALRVIRASPKWTPAKIRDNPVRVKYVFPVIFRLEKQPEKQ